MIRVSNPLTSARCLPQPRWLLLHRSHFMPPPSSRYPRARADVNAPLSSDARATAAARYFPSPIRRTSPPTSPTKEVVECISAGQLGLRRKPRMAGAGNPEDAGRGRQQGHHLCRRQDRQDRSRSACSSMSCPTASTSSPATRFSPSASIRLPITEPQLQQRADGPYRGSASKELELVEFADFQCPHCKEAQPTWTSSPSIFPRRESSSRIIPLAQCIRSRSRRGSLRRVRDQAGRKQCLLPIRRRGF